MPYNYVLNKDILQKNSSIIENSILIFDEAHNVPETARSGMTTNIKPNFILEIS